MGGGLSTGAIVGIVCGVFGFAVLAVCCSFLKTVLNHRRRVRRAVNAANDTSPAPANANGTRRLHSRYPEAIPCENYDELFPDEEPARGNVVFQSRADIDRMRDVLVRIEDAGDDRSSEDFFTTEMVSVNNSFAPGRPHVHAGHIMQETLKPSPAMVPSRMGSFDNEHNVAMSFVSVAPTPASSMPAFAARSRGQTLHSSSFNPGVGGSYTGSFASPPPAKADGAVAHFQDRRHHGSGGLRLLVPDQERGRFGDAQQSPPPRSSPSDLHDESDSSHPHISNASGLPRLPKTPLTDDSFGGPLGTTFNAQSHQPVRQPREGGMSLLDRSSANAASFNQHLAPSFSGVEGGTERRRTSGSGLRPPAVPQSMGGGQGSAARSGLLGSTWQDPTQLRRASLPAAKKHKVRIHRQHRVRKVDKGGYVVLEETESSSSDKEDEQQQQDASGDAGEATLNDTAQQQQQRPEGGDQSASPQSPSPAPESTGAAAAKKSEKKRRYYFEKLSSLDVYGRGQYLTGTGSGFPPAEQASSDDESKSGVEPPSRPDAGSMLSAATQHVNAPVYVSNSTRKPT